MLIEGDESAEIDLVGLVDAYALADTETLAGWLDEYDRAAALLDRTVAAVASLDELVPQISADVDWPGGAVAVPGSGPEPLGLAPPAIMGACPKVTVSGRWPASSTRP